MVSSRKQKNVDKAVNALKALNLSVTGLTCHVGKKEDRENLLREVMYSLTSATYDGVVLE